jgi:protoporphyrin/coproporphyrin ferrochelatase
MKTPPKDKTAVVVLQFGGPDSLEAVEPFLYNLFSDGDIVQVPLSFLLQKPLAKLISSRRSVSVKQKYAEIGGKSPIVEKTKEQVRALQSRLDAEYGQGTISVVLAMRYWMPFTDEAIQQLMALEVKNIVFLPLYAQYSKTNAGSSYNEWDRIKAKHGVGFNERRIYYYHTDSKYIKSINERIDEALTKFEDKQGVHILFSAHGIPIDLVFEGDAYPVHISETMGAIMKSRGNDLPYSLSYQSKVGPKQWLTPSTEETLKEYGNAGMKKLLIVPIAFVSDHIETSHELDIELREIAEHAGITEYHVMEGLNSSPTFIDSLLGLVEKELVTL